MNENTKSLIFAAAAVVAAVAAYFSRPLASSTPDVEPVKVLFAEFTDPLKAQSLEIVRPEEESSTIQTFKVQQENGIWVIPSNGNYPADAQDRLKTAATALIGLEVIDVAAESRNEHELYGVVQPDPSKSLSNLKGVGVMVTVKDAAGKSLASLIIGKSPKGKPDQRFVRQPSQDRVYVTKINPDQISAKFSDWIEKDLLNLNPLDVSELKINNYSVIMGSGPGGQVRPQRIPRANLNVLFDEKLNQWVPGDMTVYAMRQSRLVSSPAPLTEQEQLNQDRLNELKTALDNLEIADVRRKPAGFTADLKADKSFVENDEAIQSLVAKGFFPGQTDSGEIEIFGTDGELGIVTKDGVEYKLRFGKIDLGEEGKATADVNRFLLVSVKLHQDSFPPPQLEVEPEEPSGEAKEGEQKPDDDVAAEAKLAQERERIRKENERKMSEYNQRLNKAKNRVKELNYRFADWYYLVSDETFKKLRLTRTDIVQEAASAVKEGFGIDAFRDLERGGINPPPELPKLPSSPGALGS